MTFISYAQNLEDVMLFRALKGVEKGFYVDVGAQDPVSDSATKAFYDHGWRGINVEPVEQWFRKLVVERPKDINLQLAVSSQVGKLSFFEVPDTGMSTTNLEYAQLHAAHGFEVRLCEVNVRPLDAIFVELGVTEVHFLKIDVEGGEAEVLHGIGLVDIRPWIILVEAIEPNSQVTTHEKWEHLLTSRDYEFVYFDGLNRFYVAREHFSLKKSFEIPPNYFDDYIRYPDWLARQQASRLEAGHKALGQELSQLRDLHEAERTSHIQEINELRQHLETERETLNAEINRLRDLHEAERASHNQETNELRQHLETERQSLNAKINRLCEIHEAERASHAHATNELRQRIVEYNRLVMELQTTLEDMYKSFSMCVTAPLRAFKRRFPSLVRTSRTSLGYIFRKPERKLSANRRWLMQRVPTTSPSATAVLNSAGNVAPSLDEREGFAVIESMHPVIDTESLEERINTRTNGERR